MTYKRYWWKTLIQLLLLLGSLLLVVWLVQHRLYWYLLPVLPLVIYQCQLLMAAQMRVHCEVAQFVEAVYYRDFSRIFNPGNAPDELKALRDGFNTITSTFKDITRERDIQYHYLEEILELVDTGILSYNQQSGEVFWINEAFKKLTGIPYLKNIQALCKRSERLYKELEALHAGSSTTLTLNLQQQQVQILISASVLKRDNETYKLLAFQNVSEAVAETESKAWQRLLNVMTHEIMNSVAPISSLADTLKHRLQTPAIISALPPAELDDLELGVNTIKGRSEGLLKFTESYRSLNKITHLDLQKLWVRDLFENLYTLMLPTLEKKNIELDIILRDPAITIEADAALLEQVLINLLVNAFEAVKDRAEPTISLSAEAQDGSRILLKVADNGPGIPEELLDQIFVPFFSTRKTGSGIGLSLCKQIMLLHKGSIQIQSVQGKGATFVLSFQQPVN